MAKLTSFQADIRPLFTERDIHAMSKAFDLGSYDDVKAHSAAIYDRIRAIGGAVMPPPPPRGEGPWPQSHIDLFRAMDGRRLSALSGARACRTPSSPLLSASSHSASGLLGFI